MEGGSEEREERERQGRERGTGGNTRLLRCAVEPQSTNRNDKSF